MHKTIRILACLTALWTALSVCLVPLPATAASAALPAAGAERVLSEREALSRRLPAGYTLTGRRYTDGDGNSMYYITGQASAGGLLPGMWVDAAGNAVPPDKQPFVTYEAAAGAGETFPAAYDAREDGLVTAVEKQIGGTCWAHAAAAVMEANAIKKGLAERDTVNLSEYHLVWYSQNGYYEGVPDPVNDGCSGELTDILSHGGNYQMAGFALLNHAGPAQEHRYALDESASVQALAAEMEQTFTFERRFDRDLSVSAIHTFAAAREAIKSAVLTYGAAQISYYSDGPYYTYQWDPYGRQTGPCAYYCPDPHETDHAVTVVGWDDGFSRDHFVSPPPEDGAWLIKNSWGAAWGSGGYFWLSYCDTNIGSVCAYEVEPLTDREHARTYNGFPCESLLGDITAAANVFTAAENETVTFVSQGRSLTGRYTFRIYSELPAAADDPTAGTLLYTQSGAVTGGTWIPLGETVDIPAGTRFSVVFETTSIPAEGAALPGGGSLRLPCAFTSNPGESFVQKDGAWQDTNLLGENNVGISAFTRDVGSAPYKVTFTCPGHYYYEALADADGTVALPGADGCTWTFSYCGQPFDGTGVDRNMTVIAHCCPAEGEVNPETACETVFRCVYCGTDVLPCVQTHDYRATTVAPAREHPGYTLRECALCHKTVTDSWKFHRRGAGQVMGDFAWQYYDGALSFAGVGATPDYYGEDDDPPWKYHAPHIEDIYIGEGITRLGAWSFCRFSALKSIRYPSTLSSVGSNAFFRCYALEEVRLPASVTRAGDENGDAIYAYCSSVRRLIVEEGVQSLNNTIIRADATCALEEILLPSTLRTVGYLFVYYYRDPLQRYTVADDNPYFTAEDGILFNQDKTRLVHYPPNRAGAYYKAPASVRSVGLYGFSKTRNLKYLDLSETACTGTAQFEFYRTQGLSNVNLPAGLEKLGAKAVSQVSGELQKIYIPSSVTAAAANAFDLTSPVTLYTSAEIPALSEIKSDSVSVAVLPGHTHSFTEVVYGEDANCSETGFVIKTCVCGQFAREETPVNGRHVKGEGVVHPAACTEDGYTDYVCVKCGAPFTDDVVPAPGHAWEWAVDRAPTCIDPGEQHEACVSCGAVRSENTVMPATGVHEYACAARRAPTCTETGWQVLSCAVCGVTETEVLPAAGHTDADGNGRCDVCGDDLTAPPQGGCVCGRTHGGPFAAVIGFFHRLWDSLRRMFT